MTDKRTLLDELLPLMEQNGAEPAHLAAMRKANAGLYERWQAAEQRRPGDGPR